MICRNFLSTLMASSTVYFKSQNTQIFRSHVPVDKKAWQEVFEDYSPKEFTFKYVNKPWADPELLDDFHPKWNKLDGDVNRKSHFGLYLVRNGFPLNPLGRTGIKGKGILGRWGPNHAADPVVTRWKRDKTGIKVKGVNKYLLQFVAIKRKDTQEWAIPGGMIEPGETVSTTLRREFGEETMNSLALSDQEKIELEKNLEKFFTECGVEIYKGPVDDPRNTDNAWMETVVYNFHDESGNIVGRFDLKAGDDACSVRWADVNRDLKLYANHASFIEKVAHKCSAEW